MPDYKEMYLTLFRACEQAVQVLIKAQQVRRCIFMQTIPNGYSYWKIEKAWRSNFSMLFVR